jgi:diguanylate cyclase (GGDEF)-like protein
MEYALSSERLLAIIETQNEIVATALALEAVMAIVLQRAQELVGAAAGVIEMLDGDDMVYRAACGTAQPDVGLRLSADRSLSGLCVRRNEVLYCEDSQSDERVDGEACARVGSRSMLCVPLSHGGAAVGVLKVYDARPHAFGTEDMQTLSLLSGIVASHMTHASDYQDQQHASHHDALTGLANRRFFDARLAGEAGRLRRHGGTLALCLFDLDHFKQVNDTYGHAAGDEVLRAVARQLGELRVEDGAFRIGGDEFALILVGVDEAGASAVAQRIAAAVREDPDCRGVGVCWGITMLADGDPGACVARADAALYAAKAAARRARAPAASSLRSR